MTIKADRQSERKRSEEYVKHTERREEKMGVDWLRKSHQQTHLKAEFICCHIESDWLKNKKLFYKLNESCLFFFLPLFHSFHRRIIARIKKGIQCISFPSALVCFASTCDASHKERFFFLSQNLRYVISIAPKHTSVTGAHLTEALHGSGWRKKRTKT